MNATELSRLMDSAGLSPADVARLLELNRGTVRNWLKGLAPVPLSCAIVLRLYAVNPELVDVLRTQVLKQHRRDPLVRRPVAYPRLRGSAEMKPDGTVIVDACECGAPAQYFDPRGGNAGARYTLCADCFVAAALDSPNGLGGPENA